MNARDGANREHPDAHVGEALAADERSFVSGVLRRLAEEDPVACAALLTGNPSLARYHDESRDIRDRIRAVLSGDAEADLSQEQRRLIERTKASLSGYAAIAGRAAVFVEGADEPCGVLTSLTRKLAPERAIELYRRIAPILVHRLLGRLHPSANLGLVQQLVDRLCSEDVQLQLRTCEHARDGILSELCTLLAQCEVSRSVSRDDIERVLEETGAMDDLIAMENCVKLVAAKAS